MVRHTTLWIGLLLVMVFCPLAQAQLPAEGELIQETVNITETEDVYAEVMAEFDALNTFFPVDPLLPLNMTSRETLTNQALSILSLEASDISNFAYQDIFLNTVSDTSTSVDLTQEPGTIFIGDIGNPDDIVVITGQVTITTTNTTTETSKYQLFLEGDLLAESDTVAIPAPGALLLAGIGVSLTTLFRKRRAHSAV